MTQKLTKSAVSRHADVKQSFVERKEAFYVILQCANKTLNYIEAVSANKVLVSRETLSYLICSSKLIQTEST